MTISDRGVSDALSFVLMFSLLVTSVALVSTVGLDQLTDLRDDEQVNSADRAMQGLAATFDDVVRRTDPRRTATLSLSGGSLTLDADSRITVEVDGDTRQFSIGSLEHRIHGTSIVYESGGVVRTRDGHGVVERSPPFDCSSTDGVATVTVVDVAVSPEFHVARGGQGVRISGGGGQAPEADVASDEGVVGLVAVHRSTSLWRYDGDSTTTETVTVNVANTAAPDAWADYLTARSGWTKVSDHVFECTVSSVAVREVEMQIGPVT